MHRYFSILMLLSILTLLSMAAHGQDNITPEKRELIRQLIIITDVRAFSLAGMNSVIKQMDDVMPQILEKSLPNTDQMPPEVNDIIRQFSVRISARFRRELPERINFDEVIEQIYLPLYEKYFTEEDLKALIAFYQSPAGKKFTSVGIQLQQEAVQRSSELFLPRVLELVREITKQEEPRLREEIEKYLATLPAPPADKSTIEKKPAKSKAPQRKRPR
ncbi:MAG TPA: DUF2059 domain-containing protein [Blastocatellia bacterium]|nr:DUF2059 domain-containing protein [Blastocatellia bacterium]